MRAVVLISKQPEPGRVKTRLSATLGDAAAASLADAFLRDTIEAMRAVPDCQRWISYAPFHGLRYFEALDPDATLHRQSGGDLGERQNGAFDAAFAAGARVVIVIGMDSPQLGAAMIERALAALEQTDGVVIPSNDGGYVLLGLRRAAPDLFAGIAWGTDGVLSALRNNALRSGLALTELSESFDVDDGEDLDRLAGFIAEHDGHCVWTRDVLTRLRLTGRGIGESGA